VSGFGVRSSAGVWQSLAQELSGHAIFSRPDVASDEDWVATVAAAEITPPTAHRCRWMELTNTTFRGDAPSAGRWSASIDPHRRA
jgi:hypothetical protein